MTIYKNTYALQMMYSLRQGQEIEQVATDFGVSTDVVMQVIRQNYNNELVYERSIG